MPTKVYTEKEWETLQRALQVRARGSKFSYCTEEEQRKLSSLQLEKLSLTLTVPLLIKQTGLMKAYYVSKQDLSSTPMLPDKPCKGYLGCGFYFVPVGGNGFMDACIQCAPLRKDYYVTAQDFVGKYISTVHTADVHYYDKENNVVFLPESTDAIIVDVCESLESSVNLPMLREYREAVLEG